MKINERRLLTCKLLQLILKIQIPPSSQKFVFRTLLVKNCKTYLLAFRVGSFNLYISMYAFVELVEKRSVIWIYQTIGQYWLQKLFWLFFPLRSYICIYLSMHYAKRIFKDKCYFTDLKQQSGYFLQLFEASTINFKLTHYAHASWPFMWLY